MKQQKLDEELAGRKEALEAERRRRDAEDEAKIRASEAALAAAGVTDKETALAKAAAERAASEPTCTKCHRSLKNTGPFTRVGPLDVPYEQRDPVI